MSNERRSESRKKRNDLEVAEADDDCKDPGLTFLPV
jgi:hypothetical protein